jgi:hypothetical protein
MNSENDAQVIALCGVGVQLEMMAGESAGPESLLAGLSDTRNLSGLQMKIEKPPRVRIADTPLEQWGCMLPLALLAAALLAAILFA